MRQMVITGGTGFLGQALESFFASKDYLVTILTRKCTAANHIEWDGRTIGPWVSTLEGADVLINLTGKSVDCRYNERNRNEILHSRVDSTLVLNEALTALTSPPAVWINASSATIYTHAEKELMTEREGIIGDDFSMGICKQWEAAFFGETVGLEAGHSFTSDDALAGTTEFSGRRVAIRTSIVMGNGGGAFRILKRLAQFGLGGKHGSGRQKVSWIHIEDFCRAIEFIVSNKTLSGPVNVTAPAPLANIDFMETMRQAVGVPYGLPQPVALLEVGSIVLRTQTELLLKSRFVYPEKLLNAGFQFEYATFREAAHELVNGVGEPCAV